MRRLLGAPGLIRRHSLVFLVLGCRPAVMRWYTSTPCVDSAQEMPHLIQKFDCTVHKSEGQLHTYIRDQVCSATGSCCTSGCLSFYNAPLGVGISSNVEISVLFLHMCVVLLPAVHARLFRYALDAPGAMQLG